MTTAGNSLGATLLLPLLLGFGCEAASAEDPEASSGPALNEESSSGNSTDKLVGARVEVAVIQPSLRTLDVTVPGEVEGFHDAHLSATLGGYIERVRVKEGDRVKSGQVLLLVDSATHGARQARAKVELKAAERELERTQSLGGAIAKVELDNAEDRVASAKAALRELGVNASRAVIRAPFTGVVVDVGAEVGEVAAPGAPLVRVVQLSPIKVTVSLSDRDVPLATPGTAARVQLDARSGVYQGRVSHVSQAADLKTRSFKATVELENKDEALLPGMITSVTLSSGAAAVEKDGAPSKGSAAAAAAGASSKGNVAAAEEQLVISQDWLVTKPEGVGVFVEAAGKAEWRPVKLGQILRKQVVVEEGLKAGDALIIVGHRELVPGDSVLVHRRGRCCTAGRATFAP